MIGNSDACPHVPEMPFEQPLVVRTIIILPTGADVLTDPFFLDTTFCSDETRPPTRDETTFSNAAELKRRFQSNP